LRDNKTAAATMQLLLFRLSKKWQSHFFEKASLRSSHALSAERRQSARSLRARCFSDAHVVRKTDSVYFAPAGAKPCGAFSAKQKTAAARMQLLF
jgi:hypothetical protein